MSDVKQSKKQNAFFQKDEKGQEVFFPWGGVGDAYYVTSAQKSTSTRILYSIFSLMVLLPFIAMLFLDLWLGYSVKHQYPLIILANAFILVCIYFVYAFTKNLEPYRGDAVSDYETKIPKIVSALILCAIGQVILFCSILQFISENSFIQAYGVFIVLFYPTLITFVFLRKGYIFQSPPSSTKGSS